jgi:hypothetical protein
MKAFVRVLAIAAGVMWAASAQAGASQVGNVYYEDIFPLSTCMNSPSCFAVSSSATPAGVYVRMQHFYCRVTIQSSSPILQGLSLQVWTAPPNSSGASKIKEVNLSFPPTLLSNGFNLYNVDHEILLVTGPGRYLVVSADISTIISGVITAVQCAITGDLIPPP